jgi:biotin-(acetyl-CoA carboxylase) ligase
VCLNVNAKSYLDPLAPKAIDRSQTFKKWNQELERYVRLFANSHPKEITAMIYSSYDTFNRVLDHPELHGFTLEDIDRKGSSIWHADIHPTSAMHDIIARDIVRLLDDQRPLAGEQVSATS